jgi:YebC/PmpR family DNA-binding regulatory protein
MYDKARSASVPMDTIERAIKRGTGELEGVRYESISYEGYAPSGVAIIVETLTDNRNRTGSEVRSIFSRNGGSTAEPGAVAWQFSRKGVLELPRSLDEEAIMEATLDAGAENISDIGDHWELVCAPPDLTNTLNALKEAGMEVISDEFAMVPTTTVPVDDIGDARKVLRLIEALDDQDDVQNVWANFDIPDEILEEAAT